MIGIELFSGPGGMGLGAKKAGVNVVMAVEKDPHAAETYLSNNKETSVVVEDIRNITDFKINRNGDQLVLFGGAPCQGFSNSNRKTRTIKNPKNWLFEYFIKTAENLRPDWVVMENVPGLGNMKKGFFLEKICNQLHGIGYTPTFKILNAVDFGVPQKRERLFIVASLNGIAFEFPEGNFKDTHVTVLEAIGDLPKLKNGSKKDKLPYSSSPLSEYARKMRGRKRLAIQNFVSKNSEMVLKRYPHIRQGGNWKDIPSELMSNYKDFNRCHHNIYRRLNLSEPSPVIANYRKSMVVHPIENRGLSLREAARLQSFPDNYKFYGPLISIQQQVGDAVPPLLAESVFTKLLEIN